MDKSSTKDEFRQCLVAECLGKLISSPFFNTLRTTEALGYMVSAQMTNQLSQAIYIQFGAQSAVAGSWYLLSRISAFLDAYETDALPKITQADVDGVVKAMVEALRQPPMSVSQECNKIYSRRVHPRGFASGVEAANILETMPITIDEIKNTFATTLSNLDQGGKIVKRRNFTVSISSNALKQKEPTHEFVSSVTTNGDVQKECVFPIARSDVAKASGEDSSKLVMKRFDEDVSREDATPYVALWAKPADIRSSSTLVDIPL
jgi:secreted Zn-dependent insulinase-like peptidase